MGACNSDMSMVMFQELLSARLNMLAGYPCVSIFNTISAADSWLSQNPPGCGVSKNSNAWNQGQTIWQNLNSYNCGNSN